MRTAEPLLWEETMDFKDALAEVVQLVLELKNVRVTDMNSFP